MKASRKSSHKVETRSDQMFVTHVSVHQKKAIPENREIQKQKFSFFPSKTCIVDKF